MISLRKNQKGVAAILVSLMLILVISLILFGMFEVSDNNQSEALTNQEGNQAYDAAETAVNVAYTQILNDIKNNVAIPNVTSCSGSGSNTYLNTVGNTGTLSTGSNTSVTITCLLVNTTVTSLTQSPISTDNGVVWQISPQTGSTIGQFVFQWSGGGSGSCTEPPLGTFPAASSYCGPPILQVDLFQNVSAAYASTPTSLNQYAVNLLLQPSSSQNSGQNNLPSSFANATYPTSGTTNPREVACSASGNTCTVTVTIASPPASTTYFARIVPLYGSVDGLQVTPETSSGGSVNIVNSQVIIDATAKDQNVERRIKEVISLPIYLNGTSNNLVLPNNALESNNSICKLLTVGTATYTDGCIGDS